ncbi:glycosyl transferase family 1 [Pseudorhodoferax aquiterrae]|uniref:Glycosyl transferase family 1 n=1 Tax=Pseudorhodoferax aquiterrae TaxID=747304 RepID=A0ABQ3FUE9_9BURK|nr:glycosyltransferase family 4 protein [Pseudorhodoferax aquiterrae]GHC68944.1 glycosyl transferase family 1 [Pseudorhodoferax aquiterrae]
MTRSASRPRILFITPYLPSVSGGGAQLRIRTSLEALAAVGDVHLLLCNAAPDAQALIELETPFRSLICSVTVLGAVMQAKPIVWASQLQPSALRKLLFLAWVTTGRINPATRKQATELVAAIRANARAERFDLVFAMQAHWAALVSPALGQLLLPGGVSMLDWDAAEAPAMRAIAARFQLARQPLQFVSAWVNVLKLRFHEQALFRRWEYALYASPLDVDYFRQRLPSGKLYCLVNTVDMPEPAPLVSRPGNAPQVVFVASMSYWPNNQGILMFLRDIWPAVRTALPRAELKVVGRGPSPELRGFDGCDGVVVVGEVASVEPFYRCADVAIAPMQFSVGSAIKILEALAYGTPLVGFEVSTVRHGLRDGVHAAVAKNKVDFEQKLIELLQDSVGRRRLSQEGRTYVQQRFARDSVVRDFRAYVDGVLNRSEPGAHAASAKGELQ